MSWRRQRTQASSWNCWRATTPVQTKWVRTNGSSAMRWLATRACLRGRTISKRPGGSLILCSRQAHRSTTTSQGAGGREKSTRWFHPLVGGITRGWRDRSPSADWRVGALEERVHPSLHGGTMPIARRSHGNYDIARCRCHDLEGYEPNFGCPKTFLM